MPITKLVLIEYDIAASLFVLINNCYGFINDTAKKSFTFFLHRGNKMTVLSHNDTAGTKHMSALDRQRQLPSDHEHTRIPDPNDTIAALL